MSVSEKISVTVLIPLFLFSLSIHNSVTASAESFDNCHPRRPITVLALTRDLSSIYEVSRLEVL